MKQALEALRKAMQGNLMFDEAMEAFKKLDQAIEQAEEEEPEWLTGCPECGMDEGCDCDSGTYNPQPQREWVGLTDEQRGAINSEYQGVAALLMCEAKLREKNGGNT
jgi:hypothetical protein